MRGSPLVRILIIAIFLVLAGIPIGLLTWPKPVTAKAFLSHSSPSSRSIELSISSTRQAHIEISYARQKLLETSLPPRGLTQTFNLPSDNPTELVITARWEDTESPNAIRLIASQDGGMLAETTFWGTNEVQEVFSIPTQMP